MVQQVLPQKSVSCKNLNIENPVSTFVSGVKLQAKTVKCGRTRKTKIFKQMDASSS